MMLSMLGPWCWAGFLYGPFVAWWHMVTIYWTCNQEIASTYVVAFMVLLTLKPQKNFLPSCSSWCCVETLLGYSFWDVGSLANWLWSNLSFPQSNNYRQGWRLNWTRLVYISWQVWKGQNIKFFERVLLIVEGMPRMALIFVNEYWSHYLLPPLWI